MPLWYPSATFSPARVTGFVGRDNIHVWPGAFETIASDAFNRADTGNFSGSTADTGQTWSSTNGTWGITSNQAYLASGSGVCRIHVDTGIADGFTVEGDITAGTTSHNASLMIRYVDNSNYGLVNLDNTTTQLGQVISSSFSVIDSQASTHSNGQTVHVKATVSGNVVTIYVDDVEVCSGSLNGALASSTKHGLEAFASGGAEIGNSRWDNFIVYAT